MPGENEVVEDQEVVEELGSQELYDDGFDVFADEPEKVKEEAITATEKTEDTEKSETDEVVNKDAETETNKDVTDSEKVAKDALDTVNEGFKGAYLSEKGKRQDLENRIQLLEKGTVKPVKEVEQAKFDWSDPDKAIDSVKSEMKNEVVMMKADLSEAQCKRNNPDYAEKYQVFKTMALNDNSLVDKMLLQSDPAQWAYDQATKHSAMSEIGDDPVAFKANLRAELLAELKAELSDNETIDDKIKKEVKKLPPSGNANSGKIVKQEPDDDNPLEDVFKGR